MKSLNELILYARRPELRQRSPFSVPPRIRAIALEQQRGGTVEPDTVAVKQRDRNGFFVLGRNLDPPHHVGGRIVAAWHLLLLAQDARLALDIVVEGLLRGG